MLATNTHPVRVVHLIQNLNYGGMERVLHSLARQLPAHGFEVHVVVLEYFGEFAKGLEAVATLHQVPPMSPFSLFHPKKLAGVLRSIAPEVVHSHTGLWLKGARATKMAGIPIAVHTEHGRPDPVPLIDRLIDNMASRWTDVIVAVSEDLADVLRTQVVHDPARVRVITNGVDTTSTSGIGERSALRRELGVEQGNFVIGTVGRLEPIKHLSLALNGFARLGAETSDGRPLSLVLVGDGSHRAALEAEAGELGISSRVTFLGWRADANRLYGAFDLFTLTSRNEGTSISLLEAMSSGVCPVVTDVGGNRAVLGAGLESLLVPDNDDAGLASAWQRLANDPALLGRMGDLARQRVEQAFSLDRMVKQHVDLYREFVQRARSGATRPGTQGSAER